MNKPMLASLSWRDETFLLEFKMNRLGQSLLAFVVSGGLCGGIGLAQARSAIGSPAAQRLDEGHWRYPHMHHAIDSLREAREDLKNSEDVFKGHREDAIDHVERAIKTIEIGLKEKNDDAVLPAALPSASNLDDETFPRMRHALKRLKGAKEEMEDADKEFGDHREEAISHTDKAIHQIEDALHAADR